MTFRHKLQHHFSEEIICFLMHLRCYSSKVDWNKLRPIIMEKFRNEKKDYPARSMTPIAYDVLKARTILIEGVSTLLKVVPIKSCKFCPELHIGETGHLIKTCHGLNRIGKNRAHGWIDGNSDSILTSLEAFHLDTRVPAVIELCHRAGAAVTTEVHSRGDSEDLSSVAQRTLEAWETVGSGVRKLLLVSPAKVCEYCWGVHLGPSEHRPRLHQVFERRGCRGSHRLKKKAEVDDLVRSKMVWHRRPQDPRVLVDGGRDFYGRAPAVVELCVQAGARVPSNYCCMMKLLGLTAS